MTDAATIVTWSVKETAAQLSASAVTSQEVTQAYLDRIDRLNPSLNAYLTIFHESAIGEAQASDERRSAGKSLGLLDGIPIALKDNFSVKGTRTTAASKILDNHNALYDATVVRKLKAAGAVILGKTNLDEFAMGSSTENSAYGPSKNPWDTARVPGGSSGGSAVAVSADLCAAAFGSDTGGSIRQPAGLCSIVGLKPTYGTVSRYGLLAMASSLDQIGPMTKTVEDASILFEAIRGHDQYDATTLPTEQLPAAKPMQGVRVGIPKEYFGEGMDPAVEQTVRAAIDKLKELGAEVKEVSLPNTKSALAVYYIICPVEVASNMARYDGIRFGESIERDGSNHNLLEVYKQTRATYIGDEVKRRIMLGTYASSAGYYDAYYNQAMKVRALIKQEFDAVFAEVDCLATPISPTTAFKLGEKTDDPLAMYLADVNTVPINIAGVPAIALPCGFVNDLPVGLQLIGPQLGESTLFAVAEGYEAATDWHTHKPTLKGES
jgi:aspartyl-tRNA(Asn)/glutamyl-tRNA(Gln) amidotransferase subunit A